MKIKGVKGLSSIVATLLIILLVLVAVGILWVVVKNVLQSGAEQISLGKFTLDLEIKQVQIVNDSALNVKVKRNPGDGEMVGLDFIVDDGDNTEIIEFPNISMKELQQITFNLVLASVNTSNLKSVSIAPVFRMESGKEIIGDIKDEYVVKKTVSSGSSGGCTDTCTSLGYECGTQTVCGIGVYCGNCSSGYVCSGTSCVEQSNCTDTCTSLGYECGTQTVCGNSTNCGTCGSGETCNATGQCVTTCTDTCSSLGYECGTQTVCGASTNCGTCGSGETCNGLGQCVTTCTDTCTSLGYECGTQTICGNSTNCGTCGSGETCNATGQCVTTCTDTCTSLGYECGTQTICGNSTNCGTCGSGETCNATGICVPETQLWENGLVSWWTFDTDAQDSVGSNHGIIYGANHITSGCQNSGCYDFDSGDNIRFPDSSGLQGYNKDMTFAAWIYPVAYAGDDYRNIFGGEQYAFALAIEINSETLALRTVGAYTAPGSSFTIPLNQWSLVVVTIDYSESINDVVYYYNGGQQSIVTFNRNPSSGASTNLLGTRELSGGDFFVGNMDEIMVWNRVLNSTEISQLYDYFTS